VKKKDQKPPWSFTTLLALGIPMILIPGLLYAHQLGWNPDITTVFQQQARFPKSGIVTAVEDGDTFTVTNGMRVRMIGINTAERGAEGFDASKNALSALIQGKTIYLEYDRYQDDKYGRILAWVWVECEAEPVFLPFDYMYVSNNESRPGLVENPEGCKDGTLVNEEMVRSGFSAFTTYKDRGELKYEKRIERD